MRKIFLSIGIVIIIINSIIYSFISTYTLFNCLVSNSIVLLNTIFLYYISVKKITDGFKVALSFLVPILGLINFVLAITMHNQIKDNYYILFILLIFGLQLLLILISRLMQPFR